MINQNCPEFQIYKELKIDSSVSVDNGTPNELLTLSNLENYLNTNLSIQSNQVIQNSKINQGNEKVIFPVTCTVQNIPDYTSVTIQPNNQIINGFDLTNQQVNGNVSINGVQLKTGDYVFVNKQTSSQRNGIYQYLKIGDGQNVIICGGSSNIQVVIPPGTTILGPNSSPSPPNNQGFFPNGSGCYPDTNGQYPNGSGLYPSSIPGNLAIYPSSSVLFSFGTVWYYPVIRGGNPFYPNFFRFYPNNSFQYIVTYPRQRASNIGGNSLHFLRDTGDDYRNSLVTIIPKMGEIFENNQQTDASFIWKRDVFDSDFTYRRDIYGKYLTIPLRNNDPANAEQLFAGFNEYRYTNTNQNNNNISIEVEDNSSWKVGEYKVLNNDTQNTLNVDFDNDDSFDIAIGSDFVTSQPDDFILSTRTTNVRLMMPVGGRIIFRRTAFEKLIELVASTKGNRFMSNSVNYIIQ